ncbi:Replication factor C subunit 4 [Diplonema papillatum]|nr:Replication factor C subunit 4 [Diplonema papillatum]
MTSAMMAGFGEAKAAKKDAAAQSRDTLPWVEKYRPKAVADVVHQTEVTNVMTAVLENQSGNLPHMLFYGPPGTGKTSAILALCNQLYGPIYKPTRVLELNASDDRGIQMIRDKVKGFAKTSVHGKPDHEHNGVKYRVPPYKIIILDEADALLPDAQAALRRIIEEHAAVTRFCLICNYVSRIIEPLVSRCVKMRFKSISKETLTGRLQYIAEREGLTLGHDSYEQLDHASQGDLRLAVQYLQGASKAFGKDLSKTDFLSLAGFVPTPVVRQLYESFWSNSMPTLHTAVKTIIDGGYSASQLLSQLVDVVEGEDPQRLTDAQKANILMKAASLEKPLQDGASELLQLLSFGGYCLTVVSTR